MLLTGFSSTDLGGHVKMFSISKKVPKNLGNLDKRVGVIRMKSLRV